MAKKMSDYAKFGIIRTVIIIGIIIYIFGIIPQLNSEIKLFFTNPIIKIGILALIAVIAYKDTAIAILLAIAFLVSYLQTPEHDSPLYQTLKGAQAGTQSVIGGIQSGTTQLVNGLGSGATQLINNVGRGTQKLIGGVDRGAQQLVGGIGGGATGVVKGIGGGLQQIAGRGNVIGRSIGKVSSGATDLIGGLQEGTQNIVSGLGGTAQNLVSGISEGGQYAVVGAQSGVSQAITGLGDGAQQLIGGVKENLTQSLPGKSISREFENQQKYIGGDKGCNVQPRMTTGCDNIIGYNAPIDCVGVQPNDKDACLCSGVKVWKDEFGPQGLSKTQGFAGGQIGSTY